MKFADLHLHTLFSDSTHTPEELILETVKAGLAAIAVVDHDTVEGIEPTLKAADAKGVELIPGIELSADQDGKEVHILGYLIDYKNPDLIKRLDALKVSRVERIYKIIDKLKDIGIDLNPATVFEISTYGTVGRLHVARALLKEGKIKYLAEAFQKYIGDKSPAYVSGFKFTPKEAIKLILGVGGVPVLAHPYTVHNDDLIPEFVSYGLMGLEIYYPEHSQAMVNFYLGLAKKYNLLATGGSDCHGEAKPEIKVGSIKIPYSLVEKIKEAQEKIK